MFENFFGKTVLLSLISMGGLYAARSVHRVLAQSENPREKIINRGKIFLVDLKSFLRSSSFRHMALRRDDNEEFRRNHTYSTCDLVLAYIAIFSIAQEAYESWDQYFLDACKNDRLWLSYVLLKLGANINVEEVIDNPNLNSSHIRDGGNTPLHYAVLHENEKLLKFLLAHNANVNAQDKFLATPLHHAIEKNRLDFVRMLLEHRAEVNKKNHYGCTPLFQAGSVEMVQLLFTYGADIDVQDNDGNTPLSIDPGVTPEVLISLLSTLEYKKDEEISLSDEQSLIDGQLYRQVRKPKDISMEHFLKNNTIEKIAQCSPHTICRYSNYLSFDKLKNIIVQWECSGNFSEEDIEKIAHYLINKSCIDQFNRVQNTIAIKNMHEQTAYDCVENPLCKQLLESSGNAASFVQLPDSLRENIYDNVLKALGRNSQYS